MNQRCMPLAEHLDIVSKSKPISFHVPGHKHGQVFPHEWKPVFQHIMKWDMTEITGMDDLHAPAGVIGEAETLARDFFRTKHTFFLVGGSTVGNLAMILAVCKPGEKVIVQRNCHKSIMHGLELAGARPIFLAPEWDPSAARFANPSYETVAAALQQHTDARALVLTYPDYFGSTYDIQPMIHQAHQLDIPVLVDEAHGVHFSLGSPFPPSAIELGADVVVHSAHKMAPAMTMASYLHVVSERVPTTELAYFLQMLQSSSPSYPLMASLDIARYYLANFEEDTRKKTIESVRHLQMILANLPFWDFVPSADPLKLTFHVKHSFSTKETAALLEESGIFPELATENQILFAHGLAPFQQMNLFEKRVKTMRHPLKKSQNHATIEETNFFPVCIQELDLPYQEMKHYTTRLVPIEKSIGEIAAEAVIPYPPGIPLLVKGERISERHLAHLSMLLEKGVRIQERDQGVWIYEGVRQ